MDEIPPDQSEAKEERAAGFQLHVNTVAILVFVAAMMILASVRSPMTWVKELSAAHPFRDPEVHTFQGADVYIYGWPLPMLYVDVNLAQPKLEPPIRCNFISL